jgi:hypothetical protein
MARRAQPVAGRLLPAGFAGCRGWWGGGRWRCGHRRHRRADPRRPRRAGPGCRGSDGGRRRRRADTEQGRRSRGRGRIGQWSGLRRMLRVGTVGHQRSGQLLQSLGIRGLRLGRDRGHVREGLIGPRGRRALFGDLSALLPMPPVYWIHRRSRGTTYQQRVHRQQHGRAPQHGLRGFLHAPSLRAYSADHHMLLPLSATGEVCSRWCR